MTTCTFPAVKRGDTWIFVFVWRQENTVVDLSESTARMQIRDYRTKELAGEISSIDGIIISGEEGKITASFSTEITKNIPPGQYVTDIEVTFGDQTVISSQTIQLLVEEDVTI